MLTATQSHAGRGVEQSKAAARTLHFDRAGQSGFEAALLPSIGVIGLLSPHTTGTPSSRRGSVSASGFRTSRIASNIAGVLFGSRSQEPE